MLKTHATVRRLFTMRRDDPGFSLRKAAKRLETGKDWVREMLLLAQDRGYDAEKVLSLSDDELTGCFGLNGSRTDWIEPSWAEVDAFIRGKRRYKKTMVPTLEDAWRKYVEKYGGEEAEPRREGGGFLPPRIMSYPTFTRRYRAWRELHGGIFDPTVSAAGSLIAAVSPGSQVMIDAAGDKVTFTDASGTKVRCVIFTAVLPYSGLSFACAMPDHTTLSWLGALQRFLNWLGGSPASVKSDNESSLTLRRRTVTGQWITEPKPAAVWFAQQYGMEWVLTGAYRPRHKGPCERLVLAVSETQGKVMGRLGRGQEVEARDMEELNAMLEQDMEEFNLRRVTGRDHSRRAWFELYEREHLAPLPAAAQLPLNLSTHTVGGDGYTRWHGDDYFISRTMTGQKIYAMEFSDGSVEFRSLSHRLLQSYVIDRSPSPRIRRIKHTADLTPAERWVSMDLAGLCIEAAEVFPSLAPELSEVFRGVWAGPLPQVDRTALCHSVLEVCVKAGELRTEELRTALRGACLAGSFTRPALLGQLASALGIDTSRRARRSPALMQALDECAARGDAGDSGGTRGAGYFLKCLNANQGG